MADPRPYKQLIRWVARAFYAGTCPPKHYQDEGDDMARSKLGKIDTSGLAVITLEYLLDREWVAEEQICADLGQHHKIMRRALKYLEQEHLLMGEHRRETKRMQKNDVVKNAVNTKAAQMAEIQGSNKDEGDEDDEDAPKKQHTYSYWAIDYPRAYDMIQLRLTIMRKLLKDELDAREVLAKYVCKAAHCNKEYSSYDMPDLIQFDGSLKCSICAGNVEQVFATGQTGDDEQRKARRARLQSLLRDMESQLEEIIRMTVQLKTAQAPHLGSLTDWAKTQQAKLQAAAAGAGAADAARGKAFNGVTQLTAAGGAARTAMYQETHVQVTLAGEEAAGPSATGTSKSVAAVGGSAAASSSAAAKAPSLQPFFLRANQAGAGSSGAAPPAGAAGAASQPAVQGAAQAGTKQEEEVDEYTKQMLAMMGQGGLAAAESPGVGGPPAKRLKTEGDVKAEDMVVLDGADQVAGGAEEEEWEDI